MRDGRRVGAATDQEFPLTAREWEVIDLFASDRSPDEVADALVLSPATVRSRVNNIMRKLEVHSRADAVAAAGRLRIARR